jgi:ribonuclease HII
MGRALAGLEPEPDHVIVDGLPIGVSARETAVVKGDSKIAAIAAASIIAKVERDTLMCHLASDHPEYGFDINKGYGTAEHLTAIARYGLSVHHRTTFCPGGGTQPLF